jgi:ribosome biogenesis protein YTM1
MQVNGGKLENCFTCIGHTGAIQAISSFGGKLATASFDKFIKIWNVESGDFAVSKKKNSKKVKLEESKVLDSISTLEGHAGPVSSVVFDQDSENLVYSGSWDHSVRAWDLNSNINTITLVFQTDSEL